MGGESGPTAAPDTHERRIDLSILLVTWNVRDDVLRCVESVMRGADGLAIEVVLVDNASSDGTAEAVGARYPEVRVVANAGNVGFPRANNQALALARGRHVLFLNPDTEVGEGTLRACVDELDSNPDVGLVGCRLVYPDGATQYECARNDYRLGDLASEILYLHMLLPRHPFFAHHLMGDWDHRGDRDVDVISGAFMMARREAAAAIGGLPEDLFMYHEDQAFCLRIRRAGWRIRYLGGVTTVHHSGRSSAQSPARLYLLEGEYKILLLREAYGPAHAAVGRVLFAVRSLVRLAISAPASVVPGLGGVKRRYPRVFHVRRHLVQLVWAVWPGLVRRMVPG